MVLIGKRIWVLLAVGLVGTGLAGCGNAAGHSQPGTATPGTATPGTPPATIEGPHQHPLLGFALTGLIAPSAIPHVGAEASITPTFTGSLPAGDAFSYTMNENWFQPPRVQSSGPTSLATHTFTVDSAPAGVGAKVTFTVEVANQSGTVLQSQTATASIA